MANIKDIAQLSGVAPSTVSAILTGKSNRVKPATRERIIRVMREQRYVPNPLFYGHKQETLTTIGVIVRVSNNETAVDLEDYYVLLISGISVAALRRDCNIMLVPTCSWDNPTHSLRVHFDGRCDGLLLLNPCGSEEIVAALKERDYPFVLVNSEIEVPECNYVGIDLHRGAKLAMEHLIGLGHRHIAFLVGNWSAGRPRSKAYLESLNESGLEVREAWMPEGQYSIESGRERTIAMMKAREHRPTAIFCETDSIAFGALRALAELDMAVPAEVSVVGFDDVPGAAHSTPSLTTVRRPLTRIGAEAVNLALELLSATGKAPEHREFPAELVIRGTTAPAPAR